MAGEDAAPGTAVPVSPAEAPAAAEPVVVAEPTVETTPEATPEPVIEAPAEPVTEPEPEVAPVAEPEVTESPPAEPDKSTVEAAPEVVAPVYEAFALPDGFAAAPEQTEAFTSVLGKYNLTQEAGQELMDLHAKSLQQVAETLGQQQQDVFAQTRRTWVSDFDKSAGNRRDTILNDAKFAITTLVPDEKARDELWSVLAFTGAGDHKALINAFAAAAPKLRERAAPAAGLPNSGAQAIRPADRRYGKTTS